MKNLIHAVPLVLAALLALPALPLMAADEEQKVTEETPYVPSPKIVVDTMLSMANVHAGDYLIDLGSGDGRIIITAALEYGVSGIGVDYDPQLVQLATKNAKKAGVADKARFVERNVFKTDLSSASVVTIYLLPEYNAALKPRLYALKPGTRIVSHDYGIGDWQPDESRKVPAPDKPVGFEKASWIYYWMVPAKVAGQWRASGTRAKSANAMELSLNQRNQKVSGSLTIGARKFTIEQAVLKGESLTFEFNQGNRAGHFEGRFKGERLSGELLIGNSRRVWNAARVAAPKG